MPAGQTPHTVVLFAHNDLVDKVQPGDRVHVTGIYRAVPIRINPRVSNVKSVYKTHIDVIHYRKTDSKRLHGLDEEAEQKLFSEKRVELLKELSRKPDIYERLASALAPSIYEHEDIKKGILLQLFGGTRKDFSHTGGASSARRSTSCCAGTQGPASPSCCSTCTTWSHGASTRPGRAPVPWASLPTS